MRFAARVSTLLLLNISVSLSSVAAQKKSEILVAAAADLQPAQNQLAGAFARSAGATVIFTFGASGSLAQQIEHGAPYDVYLSANQTFVKQLADSGRLLKDTVQVYAYGRLALWSKSGQIRTLADLTKPGVKRIAIANPGHAPYGAAAKEALKSQGLWDRVEAKVVYGESVADAFQYAQSGNADAAILAYSQVFDRNGILLDSSWHERISQSGGAVATSRNAELARRFMLFLGQADGKAVLRHFGFDCP